MCDSVVAVGTETASGTTIFAKNSDRKERECQPFLQFAEASYPPRATVRCTHLEIAQVAETYRVMGHSPWWVWGFEHGVNEHAVAIGNHSVFSKEPLEEVAGLIGMDLVRLGLERGRSAREALEVIATLVETHGQAGSALAPGAGGYHNSFLLADPMEAWILGAPDSSRRRLQSLLAGRRLGDQLPRPRVVRALAGLVAERGARRRGGGLPRLADSGLRLRRPPGPRPGAAASRTRPPRRGQPAAAALRSPPRRHRLARRGEARRGALLDAVCAQ
jgi:hypothetical protein